jgi:dihydroxyacetone kinase-like protein
MEMAGTSLTVLPVDDEILGYLKAPADCAFWKV